MFNQLTFAFSYAIRNMLRDRQRTLFAMLSIGAGVAAVVALRVLGLMLTDAMTANAQAFLRGDVRVEGRASNVNIFGSSEEFTAFTPQNIPRIEDWAEQNNVQVTFRHNSEVLQAAVVTGDIAGRPGLAMGQFIDPELYPFYDIIRAEDPPGRMLGELFTGPHQVVIARRLADQTGARVGDLMRVGQAETLYTVTGIVADIAESSFDNFTVILFSFLYIDRGEMAEFGLTPDTANTAFLRLPESIGQEAALRQVNLEWPPPEGSTMRWRTLYADDILRQNTQIADVVSRFVLLLSLVGLVIGGVGIINTMLVAVNRRSAEIAILKTVGVQRPTVTLVFLAEAALLAVLGSAVGIVMGYFLSLIARNFGEQAFAVPLPWRLYIDPIFIGLALGLAITVFFSFLPTLMASSVRPGLVLRQGNIPMARAGCGASLISFVLLVVGLGLLIDLIVGTNRFRTNLPPFLTPGILGTLVTFVILAVILAVMWVLVWLMGKLPAFRNANLRIAIRGLTTHRSRTALSLLALIVGMSALGGTLIGTRSINILLYTSISEPMGGNVIMVYLPITTAVVREVLGQSPGVNGYRDLRFPQYMRLQAIGDERSWNRWFNQEDAQSALRSAQLSFTLGVNVFGNPPRGAIRAGRFLGPEDSGMNHVVIPYIPELEAHGIGLGDTLSYKLSGSGSAEEFTIVGIVEPDERTGLVPFSLGDSAVQVPYDVVNSSIPFNLTVADVEREAVDRTMGMLAAVPGTFVFDITLFDSILNRLLTQMAALPLLVAGLSLFAAAALIASTVSLATMERRRQIAIIKAVGVSRWQALRQLLYENGIVGLVGGVISLLPTIAILIAVPALSQGLVTLPVPYDLIVLMLVLSVGITLVATLMTAWSASGEKPLNVLRAE